MRKLFLLLSILIALSLAFFGATSAAKKETSAERVQRIYNKIIIGTGLRPMIPPIMVLKLPIINAYNTNELIVVYQGIIDACENDDQLALIIGHEIAHTTLMHFDLMNGDKNYQEILESQADKMGAYYIMRSGYDVCKAREFWKNMLKIEGDYLGGDHPSIAYRYYQLDVGCNK